MSMESFVFERTSIESTHVVVVKRTTMKRASMYRKTGSSTRSSTSASYEHDDVTDRDNDIVDIEEMLQNMSKSDLIGQMAQIDICKLLYANASTAVSYDDIHSIVNASALEYYIGTLGVGSVYNFIESNVNVPWTVQTYRSVALQIQNMARQYGRPPVLWGLDSIHGANFIYGATVTPQPLNLAATFNVSAVYETGRLSSRDTRAAGVQWIFTPLIGLAVEPRWSRLYETFGEDPYLVGVMASNMIQGIQYDDDVDDLSNDNDNNRSESHPGSNASNIPSRAAACAKHYIGYSKPNNGRDRSPSWIPTRHLFQYFVPPWQRVITEGVQSIMASYTEVDGVPMVGNAFTLNTLLRQRMNFSGVVLTDFQEMEHLLTWHHTAKNLSDAVSYAVSESSVDMSMIPFNVDNFVTGVTDGLHSNRFTMLRLRESVRRILQLKMQLRMFDEVINMDNNANIDRIGTDEVAVLDTVHQSIILVENRNDALPLVLPPLDHLHDNRRLNILITGPTSNSRIYQSGGWNGHWEGAPNEEWFTYGSTVYNAFNGRATYNVTYACGVDIMGQNCTASSSIAEAEHASQFVDVVIICIGEEAYAEKPGDLVQDDLHLPHGQYNLVEAIASHSKPNSKVVLIYFGGRPRLLDSIVDLVDAILIGFLPGPSAGDAIVNIMSGQVNPSGRLPITYPSSNIGGYPYYHTLSDQCIVGDGISPHYEYSPCKIQWAFGHGLSYTTFQYNDLVVQRQDNSLHPDDSIDVSVRVKNIGDVAGAETVLVFTFDEYRRTTPEYKRLRAFQKVLLQPNDEVWVNVSIPVDDLRFVGPHDDHHYVSDPDMSYWIGIGPATDCRIEPEHSMCTYVAAARQESTSKSIGACDAACDVWMKQSGCSEHFLMTYESCINMCTSINEQPLDSSSMVREGWGWNYVNCIESVVVGLHRQGPVTKMNECWKMTTLCRDVFHSQHLDEYGVGPMQSHFVSTLPLSYILALIAALISTSFICYSFKREAQTDRQQPTLVNHPTEETDDLNYQPLEDTEKEREREFIESTMSLLGLG
jgi:beta-glucosidase